MFGCQYLDKIEEGMFDDEEEIIPRGDDEDEDDAAMMEAVLNEEDSDEDLGEAETKAEIEAEDVQPVSAEAVSPATFVFNFS